jgi:hypothetical protein
MPTKQARRKYRVKVKIITSGALDIATNLSPPPPFLLVLPLLPPPWMSRSNRISSFRRALKIMYLRRET